MEFGTDEEIARVRRDPGGAARIAADILNLDDDEKSALFTPYQAISGRYGGIGPKCAAGACRRLAALGPEHGLPYWRLGEEIWPEV